MNPPSANEPRPSGRTTGMFLWGLVGISTIAGLAAAVPVWQRSIEDAVGLVLLAFLFSVITLGVGAVAIRRGARDGAVVAASVAVFASLFTLPFPGDHPIRWFPVVEGCILLLGGLAIFAWRLRSRKPKAAPGRDGASQADP